MKNTFIAVSVTVVCTVLMTACISEDEFENNMSSWVGAPITQWRWHKGEPSEIRVRENDTKVFVYPLPRQDCVVHWGVNENNLIIDYRLVGTQCKTVPNGI